MRTVGDKIDEEYRQKRQLLELCGCLTTIHTTLNGHMVRRLLSCPPRVFLPTFFIRTQIWRSWAYWIRERDTDPFMALEIDFAKL